MSDPVLFAEIVIEGYNARKHGFCPWHNPYYPGCRAHERWEAGWDAANSEGNREADDIKENVK
ncbi:MAG: hypothetical protein OEW16_11660 [Gammaproteobacteria bacterium]|nr:hypothetical protein [Gammaproteobacteria bacterium]